MPLFAFEGRSPQVHPTAFIAPTATLIGDVVVEEGASIWYGVVLRGDTGPIRIRTGANIQDNAVLHGDVAGTDVGPHATVAHLVTLHTSVVEAGAIVGNGSTVQDSCLIGAGSLVGAGSLLTPRTVVPPHSLFFGAPATLQGPLTAGAKVWIDNQPASYLELAQRHLTGIVAV